MKYTIIDLTSEGDGVAVFNEKTVFVEGALEGEVVEGKVTLQKKNYDRAETLEIIRPSPLRQKPPCPYFGSCGGCQIMHLKSEGQLAYKTKKVQQALKKIAGLEIEVAKCLPSEEEWAYRNKIQFPVGEQGEMGLYRKGSHEIIPIERCLIQKNLGEEIVFWIKKAIVPSIRFVLIRTSDFEQKAIVVLITSGRKKKESLTLAKKIAVHPKIKGVLEIVNQRTDSVILTDQVQVLSGESFLQEKILSKTFLFGALSFFQVNPQQAQKLFATALGFAKIHATDYVLDAYCGVGILAILAAEKAKRVWGFEVSKEAIMLSKKNAKNNQISNTIFLEGKAEELIDTIEQIDLIFLNPPRKGCEKSMIEKIKKRRIQRIVYISCDPATLARDVQILDCYSVKKVQPLDMFPQTTHVETVVELEIT